METRMMQIKNLLIKLEFLGTHLFIDSINEAISQIHGD